MYKMTNHEFTDTHMSREEYEAMYDMPKIEFIAINFPPILIADFSDTPTLDKWHEENDKKQKP